MEIYALYSDADMRSALSRNATNHNLNQQRLHVAGPQGTGYSEFWIKITNHPFKKMHLNTSPTKCASLCSWLNLNSLAVKPEYSGTTMTTMSIPCLLMTCPLAPLSDQWRWYWDGRVNKPLFSARKDFNYLRHLGWEKWKRMLIIVSCTSWVKLRWPPATRLHHLGSDQLCVHSNNNPSKKWLSIPTWYPI